MKLPAALLSVEFLQMRERQGGQALDQVPTMFENNGNRVQELDLRDEPEPQGPRFTDTADDVFWGSPARSDPSLPNAPPLVEAPF